MSLTRVRSWLGGAAEPAPDAIAAAHAAGRQAGLTEAALAAAAVARQAAEDTAARLAEQAAALAARHAAEATQQAAEAAQQVAEATQQAAEAAGQAAAAGIAASPFMHYRAMFDPLEVMRRHAVPDPQPTPDIQTNFLGVLVRPAFYPPFLTQWAGRVEPIPIPSNWHADVAEWGAALRAVDLAPPGRFRMAELGCGWGCWMNNMGVAARRTGKAPTLIGVEGDDGHLAFARLALADNGFSPADWTLHRGVAAAQAGHALFPRQAQAGGSWALQPIFGATEAERAQAVAQGSHDELPMVALAEIIGGERLDLLHVDIQGGEAVLLREAQAVLREHVAYVVVGTHSRQIEGALMADMLAGGWRLEIDRPAILTLNAQGPEVWVDGVHGWRNMALLPD